MSRRFTFRTLLPRPRDRVESIGRFPLRILLTLSLCTGSSLAQSLDFSATLTPWPPEAWPEGAVGELRFSTLGPGDTLLDLASFPVQEGGRVHIQLQPTVPPALEGALDVDPTRLSLCATVPPVTSPGDLRIALASPLLYADGEPWGLVTSYSEQTGLFSVEMSLFRGMVYVDREALIAGEGTCAEDDGPMHVQYALELEPGPNLVVMNAQGGIGGLEATLENLPFFTTPLIWERATLETLIDALKP